VKYCSDPTSNNEINMKLELKCLYEISNSPETKLTQASVGRTYTCNGQHLIDIWLRIQGIMQI